MSAPIEQKVPNFDTKPANALYPEDVLKEAELIDRRTSNGKTFGLGGNRFRLSVIMAVAHYKNNPKDEDEPFKEIDLAIEDVNGKKVMNKAPFDIEIFTDRVGISYTSKLGGNVTMELVEVGGKPVDNSRFKVRVDGGQLFWDNVDDDLDFKVLLRPKAAEIFKQLKSEIAARKFKWKVVQDVKSHAKLKEKIRGSDKAGDAIEAVTSVTGRKENGTKIEFFFEEEWTGRVAKIKNRATRIKKWEKEPEYPIIVDATVNELTASNLDDGQETVTYSDFDERTGTLGSWTMGVISSKVYHGGTRFQTIGIPQGSTINSADWKVFCGYKVGVPDGTIKIYADDVDDAPAFAWGDVPSDITKTAASAAWATVAGYASNTIGVTGIVQEIISRPGWTTSNDMRFALLETQTTGHRFLGAADYNGGDTAKSARLDIDYTAPSTGIASHRQLIGHGQGTR